MAKDYYEILEVSRDADFSTIKSSYRRMTIRWHPDRNPGNAFAEEEFKKIAAAYEVLSDPEKRRAYDLSMDTITRNFNPGMNFTLYTEEGFVNAFVNFFGDYLDESIPGGFRDRVKRAESNIRKNRRFNGESSGGEKCKICSDKKRLPLKQGGVTVFVKCRACAAQPNS